MSETSVLGQQEKAGQMILAIASVVSGLLVIAGLVYAAGTGARDQATLTAGGCEPSLSSETAVCTTEPMLKSQYMAVLTPASQQLTIEQAAYAAYEGRDLVAAKGALSAEVTTEQTFDASLAGIALPPAIVPIAGALIHADQALAKLTSEQARSATLTQLRSFNPRVQAAAAAVQTELHLILTAVDAPVRSG